MQNLKEQVNNLTNIDFSDDSALADFFTEGHRMVVSKLPLESVLSQSTSSSITSGTFSAVNLSEDDILLVTRSNGTNAFQCRKIPIEEVYKYAASSGYYEEATATDPAWYIEDGALTVIPTPDGNGARIKYRNYQSFNAGSDDAYDITKSSVTEVPNLPIKARHAVILFVSTRVMHRKIVEIDSALPSDLASPVVEVITVSLPTLGTLPAVPVVPSISSQSIDDFSSAAPTYTPPVFSAPDLGTVDSMNLPVVPAVPTLSSNAITTPTLPTYTGPVMAPDFSQVSTYFDTDEDTELAGSKIQQIQAQIAEFQANVQNSLNTYNKENAVFQAALQENTQEAQLLDAHEARKLQKYQAEVSTYQAEVNKEVQRWTNDVWGRAFNEWQAKYSNQLNEYSTNIQNALNTFNKENAIYQATIQEKTQEAQLLDSHEARKLQKYQSEVSAFQAEVGKVTQKLGSELQRYQAEVSKVQQANANNIQAFGQDMANYNAKIQKQTTLYNWMIAKLQYLQQQFNQEMAGITGGGGGAAAQQSPPPA